MAWARIDDGAMGNAKILRISDSAFRLWVRGLCYCQLSLTDGLIPNEALASMMAKPRDIEALCAVQVEGKSPLWERVKAFGYKVHDYLDWNDSKETIANKRRRSKDRMASVRANNKRELQPDCLRGVVDLQDLYKEETSEIQPRPFRGERRFDDHDQALMNRAGDLMTRYWELFQEHRKGAKYLNKEHLFMADALDLVRTWDDDRLEKLAAIVLKTDDEWISGTDRGFKIFALKAAWADDKLTQWEHENGLSRAVK